MDKFGGWIAWYDWDEVLSAEDADAKAEAYQRIVVGAVEEFFPLRTVKKKDTNPPWMDRKTLKMIEDRKRFFIEEGGRTGDWKLEKKRTNEAVKARKRAFFDTQKEHLLAEDANRNFFKHVRNFSKAEKPSLFDVKEI